MNQTRPFGMSDKIGYFFGDLGNGLVFQLASIYLMKFYTDILLVDALFVGNVFLFSRIVDAFTDVGMGKIADSSKPTKDGKFKPWLKRVAIFVAFASFLMYQSGMASQPDSIKKIYVVVTYLFWGSICYTAINIPYGSMASVMTNVPAERTQLSSFRSFGGIGAGVILGYTLPSVVYTVNENGTRVLDGTRFTIAAGVVSLAAAISYLVCFYMCTERIEYVEKPKETSENKKSILENLAMLISNRALLSLILSSVVLLLAMIAAGSMGTYLYQDYFQDTYVMKYLELVKMIPMFMIMPLAGGITTKVGRKEAGVFSLLVTGGIYLILLFVSLPQNRTGAYMFLVATFIANCSLGYYNLVTWAYVMDVIDDQEVKNGTRDDGTVYALYSFSRKLGQACAGYVGAYAVAMSGYSKELVKQGLPQTVETAKKIYQFSVGIPGVFYIVVALIMLFTFPLSKAKVEENNRILAERRKNN